MDDFNYEIGKQYRITCLPVEMLLTRSSDYSDFRDKHFAIEIDPEKIKSVFGIPIAKYKEYVKNPVVAKYMGYGIFSMMDGPNFDIPLRLAKTVEPVL